MAQAALEYRRTLFRRTKDYSDNKRTFAFSGELVLSDIPQLDALYEENDARLVALDEYVGKCEAALSKVLKEGGTPSAALVDSIATCKVKVREERVTKNGPSDCVVERRLAKLRLTNQ